ncbi:hypothetical protein Tco_0195943 [Tanacetum coccineum]
MPPRKAPRTRTTPATTTNTTSVTNAQLQAMIDQGVTAALATRDANRSTNGEDSHNSRMGVRRTERVARECTYQDFMKCQPLFFKGTEGVIELNQWFERMETVFRISNCTVENQIKFSTCTLLGVTLTWWNSHVRTVGHDVAYAMTKMFPEEFDKIEKYVDGLPDMIHRSVMASSLKTMQDAIEMATELMDKKISTLAERASCTTMVHVLNPGHYRSDCQELKNQNHGNQAEGTGAHRLVHALGGGEADQDLNDMEDDISA